MFKSLFISVLCFQGLFGTLSAINDKEAVYQRLQEFTAAFNQDKEDSFPSFFTEDAEFSRPLNGEVVEGKEAITKFLQERSKEISKRQLKFTFKPEKIDFPDSDTAIVDGVSEISDNGALLQRNARRVELVKDNGQWFLDSVKEIEVAPAPPVFDHLKGLEWMIGKWVDKDDDVTITYTTNWDKFKNFIVQRFKMEVLGTDEMEGIQIIGWDPIEQKIRSWVYDSDGGFGNGQWTNSDGSWNVALNYVLSDGKKATATHVYKPIDDKSFSFASINRTINGEALPEISSVTVLKEE